MSVKNTVLSFYNGVDASDKAALEAALAKFNEVKVEDVTEEAKQVFGDVTLADGETVLYFEGDTLSVGSKLYADEGLTEEISGPADFVTSNGDMVSIDEFGNVTDIVPAGEEAPAEEEQAAAPSSIKETTITETAFEATEIGTAEEVKEEFQTPVEEILMALQPMFDEINARFEALEGTSAETEEAVTLAKEKAEAAEAKAEKLAKMPAATPYTGTETKNNFNTNKRLSMFDRAQAKGFTSKHKNK